MIAFLRGEKVAEQVRLGRLGVGAYETMFRGVWEVFRRSFGDVSGVFRGN